VKSSTGIKRYPLQSPGPALFNDPLGLTEYFSAWEGGSYGGRRFEGGSLSMSAARTESAWLAGFWLWRWRQVSLAARMTET
jgi:hypothetical protein